MVLGVGVGVGLAFNFQNEGDTAGEFDEEIGFVNLRISVKFVRDIEFEAVVSDIANDNSFLGKFLKLEYGRLFPGVGVASDKV